MTLLFSTASMQAATAEDYSNVIYIKDAKVKKGGTIELPVYLKNTDYAVKSFQFSIALPEGVSFVSTDDGYARTIIPSGWTSTASTKAGQSSNTALVLGYYVSASNLAIPQGGDAKVMTLTLQASADATGVNDIIITPTKLTDGSNTGHSFSNVSLTSSLSILPLGDVNGDGKVSIADLPILIAILNGATDTYGTANLDGDADVDLDDVNALINMLLEVTNE